MDFFALNPQFQVLKKTSFTTCIGHFLTICLATISLIYLYIQLDTLTNQTQPNVIISENQPLNTPAIALTRSNFTFVISITNGILQSFEKNQKYYNLTVNQCQRSRIYNAESSNTNVTLNCTAYPLEPCELGKHLVTDYQKQYFQKFKLSSMYCVNPEIWDNRNMNFQGHSQSDNFQYIAVKLDVCKNSTTYQNCSPTAEISKALSAGYFVMYLSDSLIKMGQPGRPYEDIITIQSTPFSYSQSIQLQSMFKIASTETDVGLIDREIQQEKTIVQSLLQQSATSYNNYYLVSNVIFLDQRENLYTRTYIKLQTILGNVGGFWQIISLIISAILSPVLQTYMNLSLVSKFFKFEGKHDVMLQSQENDIPISFDNKEQQHILDNIFPSQEQDKGEQKNLAEQQRKLKDYLRRKKNPNKFTFQDAILMYFGCKGNQQRTLRFAVQKVVGKLDIAFILKKLHEIDKLKSIIFTNEQLKLFNYIPKPLIPNEMFHVGFSSRTMQKSIKNDALEILEDEKTEILKLEESFSAYTRIRQKTEQTELDKVMIASLDEEIKGIFEYLIKKQANFGIKNSRMDSIPISPRDEEFLISQEPKADKVKRN